ncbi:MAG: helix-turn-helix transcriptional regulator [Solirubrobacteraceae bacterium]
MTIVVHLDRVLAERQMSLTELAARIDLTLANLSILKTGKARAIRFSTLEAICRELGCQPGDLLERVDEAGPSPRQGRRVAGRA